jgi:hypothetical protein
VRRGSSLWTACAVVVAATLWSLRASAQLAQEAFGIDLDGAVDHGGYPLVGGDVRFGLRRGMPPWAFVDRTFFSLAIQPELIAGLRFLPSSLVRETSEERVARAGGGLRFGMQFPRFELFAYGHASVALRNVAPDVTPFWDAGLALDYRFSASSLGIQAGPVFLGKEAWWEFGVHFETRVLP